MVKKQEKQTQLPWEAGVATIIYKPWKLDIFEHADFCRRWFRVVDMAKMEDKHGRTLVSREGEHFTFRQAMFYNFKKVYSDKPQFIVRCEETGEVWILIPNWARSLAKYENGEMTLLISQPVKDYRAVLKFMSLFYGDGTLMKRLISNGTIKEILK